LKLIRGPISKGVQKPKKVGAKVGQGKKELKVHQGLASPHQKN